MRWWNRLKVNILSLIPHHHSFLEPFDVIQPLPLNVDLVKLFCQLWWDSMWWLAFTCDSHSADSYLWYFRLNTTTAAQSDDKEKNQQLWALSYSNTLYRPVFLSFSKSLVFPLKALKDIELKNGEILYCQSASCDGVDDVTLKANRSRSRLPGKMFVQFLHQANSKWRSLLFLYSILNNFVATVWHPSTTNVKYTPSY